MQTNTTDTQIKAIIAALREIHVMPFENKSGDPKYNAQRNLNGRTHYVEDDTLRWHHSRITSSRDLHGGLLFRVTCSDALDMNNTKRGFRTAVFDVFGTCVSRPELENAEKTSQKAIAKSDAETIDLVQHYANCFAEQAKRNQERVEELERAQGMLRTLTSQNCLAA